jgi:hypothetical protein
MKDLIWRPEPKRLAEARDIICEVLELLVEILEHDYSNSFSDAPEDPIEIRYYWRRCDRGVAWQHLMRHPPIIDIERNGEREFFGPVFEPKRHPYRKNHGADYWAWCVMRWELIPEDAVKKIRKGKRATWVLG